MWTFESCISKNAYILVEKKPQNTWIDTTNRMVTLFLDLPRLQVHRTPFSLCSVPIATKGLSELCVPSQGPRGPDHTDRFSVGISVPTTGVGTWSDSSLLLLQRRGVFIGLKGERVKKQICPNLRQGLTRLSLPSL